MVFNVNLGFAGLTSPGSSGGGKSGKPYALFVGDTVLVEGEVTYGVVSPPPKTIIKQGGMGVGLGVVNL